MPSFAHPREFSRVPIRMRAELIVGRQVIVCNETRDISARGAFVRTKTRLPVGTECEIHLELGAPPTILRVHTVGRIVRSDQDGLGLRFDSMDVESFQHLRNLVLYNSSTPERVQQEFESHIGLKPLMPSEPAR